MGGRGWGARMGARMGAREGAGEWAGEGAGEGRGPRRFILTRRHIRATGFEKKNLKKSLTSK